jgi:hypothetical protein
VARLRRSWLGWVLVAVLFLAFERNVSAEASHCALVRAIVRSDLYVWNQPTLGFDCVSSVKIRQERFLVDARIVAAGRDSTYLLRGGERCLDDRSPPAYEVLSPRYLPVIPKDVIVYQLLLTKVDPRTYRFTAGAQPLQSYGEKYGTNFGCYSTGCATRKNGRWVIDRRECKADPTDTECCLSAPQKPAAGPGNPKPGGKHGHGR